VSDVSERANVIVLAAAVAVTLVVGMGWHHKVAPSAGAETTSPGAWTGVWMQSGGDAAVIKLRQAADGRLSGSYLPDGGREAAFPFSGGKSRGGTATFRVKAAGSTWGFRMTRSGETATVVRWQELGSPAEAPRAPVVIAPRTAEERARDAARLAERREELRRALAPADYGMFERVGE
jgi:hypothetical protein